MEEGLAHNTKDEPSPVNDLNCPLCFDILLDPVTLVCGHTYCEICLAQLWKNEERNWTNEPPSILCPSCRNPTDKFPQVNFMLRDVIDSKEKFKGKLAERRGQFTDEDRRLLEHIRTSRNSVRQQAETARDAQQQRGFNFRFNMDIGGQQNNNRTLCICITAASLFCLLIMAVILVSFGEPSHEKYIESWTPEDVAEWCSVKFQPWGAELATRLSEENVDGKRLLSLKEEEIFYLWKGNEFRRKSFMVAIDQLRRGRPVRQPRTLAEFNEYFFKDAVRFIMIYQNLEHPNMAVWITYYTNFNAMFLPFYNYVRSYNLPFLGYIFKPVSRDDRAADEAGEEETIPTDADKGEKSTEIYEPSHPPTIPSYWQLFLFGLLLFLVSPHVFVLTIAWDHLSTNPIVCVFVIVHCLVGVFDHIKSLILYVRVGLKASLRTLSDVVIRTVVLNLVFYVLWWFLPMFVWTIVFYISVGGGLWKLSRLRNLQN
jgi:bifunctional apoptosis regulator